MPLSPNNNSLSGQFGSVTLRVPGWTRRTFWVSDCPGSETFRFLIKAGMRPLVPGVSRL